jgi:RNA polymerase primary sigma factor
MLVLIVKKNLLKRTPRSRELKKELGHAPANDEVGSRMHLPAEKVQEPEMVSLEALVGRYLIEDRWDSSSVDEEIESVDEEIEPNVGDEAAGILKTLSPREEQVIRMRFGIGCERVYTLEEIGQKFDLTRERIRQIEAEALRQLRAPERARRRRD